MSIKAKFYTFDQNNSGGYFVTSDEHGIGVYVVIQATSEPAAWGRLQRIGENVDEFNEYCECCGERWSGVRESGVGDTPMAFGEPLSDLEANSRRTKYFVHMMDGTFEAHALKAKP